MKDQGTRQEEGNKVQNSEIRNQKERAAEEAQIDKEGGEGIFNFCFICYYLKKGSMESGDI